MKGRCGLLFFIGWLCVCLACAPSDTGYGVLLWTETSAEYKNGEIVKIISSSKLNESYEILAKDKKTKIMVPWWRIEFLKTRKAAKQYAEQYLPFANAYVFSTKEGVPPVREKIGNDDSIKIIYKFKENQAAKVLSRSEDKITVGNLEGYWYYVLLQNDVPVGGGKYKSIGIKGYCFGYNLQTASSENGEDLTITSSQDTDANDLLEIFFSGNWKPIGFQDMLDAGKIILEKFNPAWGIFPERENNKINIVLEKLQYAAEYKEILKVNYNTYTFPDSTLKLEILSPHRLSATFITKNSGQVNFNFANIKEKMEDVIENEIKRRDEIYNQFYSQGALLSSSAYGTIELKANKEFTWSGLDKLIPAVIPKAINGAGTISFPYFLSPALENKYQGVLSLNFQEYAPAKGVNFLYQFSENGIKMFFIDNSTITDNMVTREGNNQFIIVFTFKVQ